jgi:hypothetical protein
MNILFTITNIVLLVFFSVRLYKQSTTLKKIYWPALFIKLTAGILLGLLYTYYYTVADTFGFFEDGKKLSAIAREGLTHYAQFLWRGSEAEAILLNLNFTEPRALFMSKIVSIFCLLTHDNYWIISLYFSLLSFCCSWKLVDIIVQNFPTLKIASVFAFLFIPSIVFWGSGLMKESVSMAALFFLSMIALKIWIKARISIVEIVLSLISFWILWQLKYYYAAIFLPTVATCIFTKLLVVPVLKIKSPLAEVIIWCLMITLPFILISFSKENFQPDVFLKVIVRNYQQFQDHSEPGDAIVFNNLTPEATSILLHSPWALCSGLFRPFIWETQNFLQFAVSVENIFLLVLLITAVPNVKLIFISPHRSLLLSMILYIVVLCIFLTLSTPNFGTLSRYRVGFLPFLFFLISIRNPVIHYLYNSFERLFLAVAR